MEPASSSRLSEPGEALLTGQRELLELIARDAPIAESLDALCRLIERVSPPSLASIRLVGDGAKVSSCTAAPSLPRTFLSALDGKCAEAAEAPCALAARGQQAVVPDIATDARWSSEYRHLALQHGLRACSSTPIKAVDGHVLGILEIYLARSGEASPLPDHLDTFTQLARLAIERSQSTVKDRSTRVETETTERKIAEEALRSSEERYALAMEASGEGFWDWNIVTGEYYVSPQMNTVLGFSPGEAFKSRAEFLDRIPFHPEDRPLWKQAIDAYFAGASPRFDIEVRLIPDGKLRWVHSRGVLSRDASGEPVRWTGSCADVTERRNMEDALRLSERRYALAMEATREGHWDWDIVNDKYYASELMLEICGLPADMTFTGRKHWLDTFPFYPGEREAYARAVAEHFAGKTAVLDMEIRVAGPGKPRWIHLTGLCLRDASGKPVRWAGSMSDVTERRTMEEALQQSEERYARVIEAAQQGYFEWNLETDELFVSPRLKEMVGLPADAPVASRDDRWAFLPIHPADRDGMIEAREQLIAGSAPRSDIEYRVVTPVGETRWMRSRGMVFRNDAGRPLRMSGTVTDITDEKLAQAALRESEARFRGLTELSSDWYWRQDENFRFTYLSSQALDLTGHTGESSLGKQRWELSGMTPLTTSWPEHKAELAAHKPFRDLICARLGKDSVIRYLSMTGAPIFDAEGGFKGYHGIGRNITEQKRIEEELRARQQMLDLAQRAAGAAAFEWRIGEGEEENRLTPELAAMHGLVPGVHDAKFEVWKKLIHPEDWPAVRAAIKTAQQTGDIAAEYRIVAKDGTLRWLQAKGQMHFNPEGEPAGVVGFLIDVTHHHAAEEELRRMENELRQAQRLEAMGTLAGGIAHDFNNLLGAILGYGEMALRDAPRGSRLRRDIESIMIAGERGRELVDRILAFSRSGIGEHVAVHVQQVARETLELVAANLPRNVVIEQKLRAGRAAVWGDATQIHQVLMNLATNAVHAMPSGGTLRVSLDPTAVTAARLATTGTIAAREYVVLRVSDTGTGIAPEIVERIFDPFFTTKEIGVGTGLGLSLVHGIVTRLGGTIDVETRVGKGTTFTVYFPRSGDVPAEPRVRRRAVPAKSHGHRERILVVDDEKALVTLMIETLNELGYAASGHTSGAVALDAFRAHPDRFDAMITDESMPGLTGSELISEVRKIRPTLPILLVSGFLSTAVVQRAHEAGADDVLRKPLSVRELGARLARLLLEEKQPSGAAERTPRAPPAPRRPVQRRPRRRARAARQ